MQYTITQRQQHVPMKQMSHFREALSLIYREYGGPKLLQSSIHISQLLTNST